MVTVHGRSPQFRTGSPETGSNSDEIKIVSVCLSQKYPLAADMAAAIWMAEGPPPVDDNMSMFCMVCAQVS